MPARFSTARPHGRISVSSPKIGANRPNAAGTHRRFAFFGATFKCTGRPLVSRSRLRLPLIAILLSTCLQILSAIADEELPSRLRSLYVEKLAEIEEKDANSRYELALWALDQYREKNKNIEALELAVDELDMALELDPATPHAETLHRAVREKYKIVHRELHPDFLKMAFAVIGGLGIFLLGMKNMSEGMQAVAGHRLRRMISAVTDNRFLAVGTGLCVTCFVQSSSITTVLVVGLVNSGLMMLHQAIGVIMGANIGTTITGWILVLKIGKWGLPILGVAAFAFLFSRTERARYIAMAIMGVGMIFFGLELMKNGFKPMKDYPAFAAAFEWFRATSYIGVLKCAAIGCILTFIVQSSSATLGITIGLASVGAIPFQTAAALVLGENVGTTITAWLASLGATTNAKRAAYFHVMFNIIGVAWVTAVFPKLIELVGWVVHASSGSNPIGLSIHEAGDAVSYAAVVTAGIATTHTLFNVTNTVLFTPFVRVFARFLERTVPDKAVKESPHLAYLDVRMLDTPSIGIQQSQDEIVRMGERVKDMLVRLKETAYGDSHDEKRDAKIFELEEVLDLDQKAVTEFLSKLLSGQVPAHVTEEGRRQFRIADEIESNSDYVVTVLKLHLRLRGAELSLTSTEHNELTDIHDRIAAYIDFVFVHLGAPSPDVLPQAKADGEYITHLIKDYRDQHLARVSEEDASPLKSLIFADLLNAYRKIRDHTYNIAEAIAGEK